MKYSKKIWGAVCCLLGVSMTLSAQQDMLLTQEYFSRVNRNPAATGNSNDIDIFLHGRIQWVGVDNGPKTFVLNATDYEDKIRSGFGLSYTFDAMGVKHHNSNVKVSYNYQFNLNKNNILALGLGAGVNILSYNNLANILDDDSERSDLSYLNETGRVLSPDFSFGLDLNNPHFNFGASIDHILAGEESNTHQRRTLYAYVSVPFVLGEKLDMIPSLTYMHQKYTNVADLTLLFFLQRSYWAGVTWRPDVRDKMKQHIMAFTLGFDIKKFRFGYSYDLGIGADSQLPANTHEVMLSYGIGKNKEQ